MTSRVLHRIKQAPKEVVGLFNLFPKTFTDISKPWSTASHSWLSKADVWNGEEKVCPNRDMVHRS